MKQSTKLLSLVLAIVMAFSCMSVIGSAAGTITTAQNMAYDSIDDALLTPEQVADIALDLVEGLLSGLDIGDNGVLGFDVKITYITLIDFRSVDQVLDSLYSLATGPLFGIASSLVDAGDIKNLTFDPLEWESTGDAVQRSNGNIQVALHLLDFLGCHQNASVLRKAPYGIDSGVNGCITLGSIGSLANLDMSDINEILMDIPGLLGNLIYDLLLYGSYRHPMDSEELKEAGEPLPYGSTNEAGEYVISLDHMLENAVLNLVVDPQDYKYEDDVKIWEEAILLPSLKAKLGGEGEPNRASVLAETDLNTKSVFDIINYVAQFAINDLGVNALNHNLKKGLMEAVEVEFNEIEYDDVPGSLENDKLDEVKDIFKDEDSYVTYIGYDCMAKDEETGDWYYTTLETEVQRDGKGNALKDENGNELTQRVRKYFKANTATKNAFYDLINWDYVIYGTDDVADDKTALNTLDYNALMSKYGSLVESLNHLIYVVYENALTDDVKADFAEVTGDGWLDGATSATLQNSTEKILNYNINRLVKYLLAKFPDKIFGSDSPYADTETYTYDGFYADMTIIDIAALIGPGFFADVMPQLIMPVDENGAYAFASSENGSSVALLQFGALVLREFMTEITPNINYDDVIFAENTLTSPEGRQFADHSADEWFNIILNMGVDIGYTYLGNITNFGDSFTFTDDGTAFVLDADGKKITLRDSTLPEAHTAATAIDDDRWMGMLDEAINWAVGYVGMGSNGVLTGINPATIKAMDGDPFGKLSYVLNTILPLGFVNGCNTYVKNADGTETGYDVDVEVIFNKLKTLLTTFDLTTLASLFGRNTTNLKRGNILAQPVIPMVLGLVNDILYLVFGKDIFPDESSLDNVIKQENLSAVIYNLLTRLNAVAKPLLMSALPVVGKLIKGWGTEQRFASPDVKAPTVIQLNGSGATTEAATVTVKNGADGIWRSWVDANGTRYYDDQYQIELTDVAFIDFETNKTLEGVSESEMTTGKINYGKEGSFKVSASGLPGSKVVRMDIYYKVYEGSNEMVAGATYKTSVYSYLSNVPTDENKEVIGADTEYSQFGAYTAQYFDVNKTGEELKADIEERPMLFFRREAKKYGIGSGKADKGTSIECIAGTDEALTPGYGYADEEFGENNTRNFDPIKIFVNGNYTCTGDKTDKTLNISNASINVDKLAEKKHGDVTTFTFRRHQQKAGNCGAVTNYDSDVNLTLVFYDPIARGEVDSAVSSEIRRGKVQDDYLTTGFSYADRLLATKTVKDEETGEVTYKETNSTLTAWVDSEGEPIADGVNVTPDAEDPERGTYEVDGKKYSAKLVTKIDNSNVKNVENGANVWATYTAAVKAAAAAGLDGLTANGVKSANYEKILEDLNAAATDLSYCKADVESDPTVSNAITGLKTVLKDVEEATTDKYDYTDYMMWRLNRLNDARDDAAYYINLKKDADRSYSNVDKKFPYTSIEKDDLQALVADADNADAIGNNGALILALLEDLTTQEQIDKNAWLDNRDDEYAGVTAFDIALAKSMLQKTSTRLLNREYKADNNNQADVTYLATEIASAEAMIGDDPSPYTERSWAKYDAALTKAKEVAAAKDSQKEAFDAKWELLCCRNELVLVEDEADYSELETLMKQAQYALTHQDKYDNTAKELGQVLAELGFCSYNAETGKFTLLDVETADGYGINLFPGSAAYTNTEPYAKKDQDIIDSAADQLKEALARLNFYNVSVGAVEGEGNVAYSPETTIVFDDPATKDVDESVVVNLATIGAGLDEDAVKGLFNVTADGGASVGAANITVSNDRHYSIEKFEKDEEGNIVYDEETGEPVSAFKGFAGTNSVVTFYTVQDGIKIPVATIKLVVNGDVNGDGTVDVIDAAQLHLATSEIQLATLEGCYFLAGNLAGATDDSRVIDKDDYTQIINAVVA